MKRKGLQPAKNSDYKGLSLVPQVGRAFSSLQTAFFGPSFTGHTLLSPVVGAQTHLIMENRTLALPVCTRSDGTSDMAQHGLCCSRLQVQISGEGKAPAKVLVGWGRGPCSPDQIAPMGIRKSRWLPYFLPGEDGSAAAQVPLLAPVQDQGQDKCPCPTQAPPASTQANIPALDTTPISVAVETYTCNLDPLTNTNAITKDLSQDLLPRNYGNQWSIYSESSKGVTSCQDKVNFHSQDEPPTPAPTPNQSPDQAQELEVARRLVLPKQPENQLEKPLVCTSRPSSPKPGSGPLGTPKSQRGSQEICSSQPYQQPFNVCDNTCSNVPLSAHQVNYHKQSPAETPREAMQIPLSSAPTCQLQDAVEDRVLVFDMATGNTRMGLLCHDPMGSPAVLVGLMPSHSSIRASENLLSTRPLAMPILSPDSNRSSLWSTTPMVSSPVPSSLSSGSYREVALVPKEARVNLESVDSPGTETPIRMGMLTGPIPLGMPLQFGERTLSHAHGPGWSKPDAEKNEASHTIWMLDASRMQDTSMVQAKKLQWMNSEQSPEYVPPAKTQDVPRPQLQKDVGSNSQKEDMAAVVIDTGTGFTKCGLAGEDHVLSVVPSRVQLLQHPVQGQPRLGVRPEELAVLVADSPISPRTNREKVAEILFERFHVPAMQTVHQALLALYAYGRTTGLVLGSGHGTSYVAPIITGDLAPLDTYRLDVAELVHQIKEACCYVAMDMTAEMARAQAQARPNLLGFNQPGLPQLALLSISRLETKQQEQLLANVVLDGGSTLLNGFPERLRQELGPCATSLWLSRHEYEEEGPWAIYKHHL
ncbi:hypothetical protein CB1_000145037 [Camelus ferus]|nr:hypothetical protein CB1_000145037 [Camelus ferus]